MKLRKWWLIPVLAMLLGGVFCINRPVQLGDFTFELKFLRSQPGTNDEGGSFEAEAFANSSGGANLSGMSLTVLNTFWAVYILRTQS